MSTATLDNVNFQILLKQHGGNFARAKAAWDRICELGRFGAVPHTYEGGLDVKGLNIALEEIREGTPRGQALHLGQAGNTNISPTLSDDIKRIEDLAAGDTPTN